MKQILTKVLIVALVLVSTQSGAQSLQSFIDKALQSNYQINIVRNEAKIASQNNTMGNAGQLPTIGVDGSYSKSYNNTSQSFADGSIREGNNAENANLNLSALANWTVFNGFSIHAKKKQLGYLESLGQINTKFYIEQTVTDIVSAYYQLIYENQLLKSYKQSLDISAFRLKIEEKRKSVGAGKAIDYGQALVDYQTDSIRYIDQQNSVLKLEVALNKIVNEPLEQAINIDDVSFEIKAIPAKEVLFDMVAVNNSSLEQQYLQELIAETEVRIAKAKRYPQIGLFAGYQYANSFAEVGFIESNENYGPTVGVSVSFNLYNGGNTHREVKNAHIYKENAQLTKEQLHQSVDAELLNLYRDYYSLTERISLAKSNVEAMNGVYETAALQLKKGAINGYDFRLTQLSLINAELSLMQLQYTLKAVEVNMNRLSGKVLEVYL